MELHRAYAAFSDVEGGFASFTSSSFIPSVHLLALHLLLFSIVLPYLQPVSFTSLSLHNRVMILTRRMEPPALECCDVVGKSSLDGSSDIYPLLKRRTLLAADRPADGTLLHIQLAAAPLCRQTVFSSYSKNKFGS